MEELGQGGRSREATAGSASTRWSDRPRGTCSSPSTPTRDKMRSSASSTGITAVLYLASRFAGGAREGVGGVAKDVLVQGEEAAAAQDEQGEEARGDEDLADPQGKAHVLVDGGEDDEDALDEDGDPSHEEDGHGDLVAKGRAAGQALQEIREGNQPAHDEDGPGDLSPRRIEEAV